VSCREGLENAPTSIPGVRERLMPKIQFPRTLFSGSSGIAPVRCAWDYPYMWGFRKLVVALIEFLRETRGGFRSVEDFGEALDLKPHKVERIRPLVCASTPVQRSQPPESPGRVVDY
jgi:hypothetical protein